MAKLRPLTYTCGSLTHLSFGNKTLHKPNLSSYLSSKAIKISKLGVSGKKQFRSGRNFVKCAGLGENYT